MKRAEISEGSVIHGTHRHRDLIPALLGFLDEIEDLDDDETADLEEVKNEVEVIRGTKDGLDEEGDAGYWALENLFDLMNSIAPYEFLFGVHEGDGSDFGFWKYGDPDDCE